jgi:hypothetical protein
MKKKQVFRWSIEVGKPASLERLQTHVRKHPDVVHARYVGLITTIPKRLSKGICVQLRRLLSTNHNIF